MPTWIVGAEPDWPTLGLDVAEWIERYLRHGPGDVEGERIVLDDEEVDLLCDLYRHYPHDHPRAGRRVVRHGLYSRAKGRRKSELAGAICCVELRGPARAAGWDGKHHLRTRSVTAPFIRCLATEEGQSGNTYDNVRMMLELAIDEYPQIFGGIDVGLTRVLLPGNTGEIRPSTASSAAKDGGKETFGVADEVHLYVLLEHRQMHRTVSRNMVKRKAAEPWMLDTTTFFRPGQRSVAETTFDRGQQVEAGKVKAGGLYINHREGTPVTDWRDDNQILVSLREAYGDFAPNMDLEAILHEEIRSAEAEEADSRRYFLNQRHNPRDAAFDVERWATLAHGCELAAGTFITLGFDGALVNDSTGLVATEIETGRQHVLGVWECPPDDPDWQIDVDEVTRAVDDAFDRFDVWRAYCDPPWWQGPIADWQGRHGANRVIAWQTYRTRAMAFALQAFNTAVAAGELTHDGDADYARHVGNARRTDTRIRDEQTGRFLWVIGKDNAKSPRKIDLAMAGCLSWEARRDAIAAGAKPTRRRRRSAAF